MLRILSRRHLDVGNGYDALVLTDAKKMKKIWIRLQRAGGGTLLRFWSRDANQTCEADVEALVGQLRRALGGAAPNGAGDHDAVTIWPLGWELWVGLPVPISDEYLARDFAKGLVRSRVVGT